MAHLKRSPFKIDRIESDPKAFGLRITEISTCLESLYNGRNILISGTRGIGKSSLGSQLQTVYQGEKELLKRCRLESNLPKFLTVFYACDDTTTLASLSQDILFQIEHKSSLLPKTKFKKKKITIEMNLGVFKAALENEAVTRSPSSIVTKFAAGLEVSLNSLKEFSEYEGINIFVDELDQLAPKINFGHFLKMLHENLSRDKLDGITFILAGQKGVYTRLLTEDASAERIIRHISIPTLDPNEARYVLDYAASSASPRFQIQNSALQMILSLSAGYPYVIHLLGDAAFNMMKSEKVMTTEDVIHGLEVILKSDKKEKYLNRLTMLTVNQKFVLLTMAKFSSSDIPLKIPIKWIVDNFALPLEGNQSLYDVLLELETQGHAIINKTHGFCMFSEELFRVFICLLLIDLHESQLNVIREKEEKSISEQKLQAELEKRNMPSDEYVMHVLNKLSLSRFNSNWKELDYSDLIDE